MATKIWYPEPADRVVMLNGDIGYVHPDWTYSLNSDQDSWNVVVSLGGGNRLRHGVKVAFSALEGHWEEQEPNA